MISKIKRKEFELQLYPLTILTCNYNSKLIHDALNFMDVSTYNVIREHLEKYRFSKITSLKENNTSVEKHFFLKHPCVTDHPQYQSQFGRDIVKVVSQGFQVIVFTHSDHILNGIRCAIKANVLDAEKVKIYYFDDYIKTDIKGNEKYITNIKSPKIYQDGGIHQWSEGFFDQMDKDFMELFNV